MKNRMKIKKGDTVKIISGNDKGKTGKVMKVYPASGRILVEGVNMKKKHVRSKKQGQKGELVKMPLPFPASRAMLICSKCGQPSRIGYQQNDAGVKMRVCKKCEGNI